MDSRGKGSEDSSGKKNPPPTTSGANQDETQENVLSVESPAALPLQTQETTDNQGGDIKAGPTSATSKPLRATQPGAVAVGGIDAECIEIGKEEREDLVETTEIELERVELNENSSNAADSKGAAKLPTVADIPVSEVASMLSTKPIDDDSKELSPSPLPPPIEQPTSVPMVQAELVAPPVQAYNVAIDEDSPGILPLEIDGGGLRSTRIGQQQQQIKSRNMLLILIAFLLVLVLVVAISVPVVLLWEERGRGERDFDDSNDDTDVIASPAPAPSFSYPCFTSTWDILQAQRDRNSTSADRGIDEEDEVYTICPNTTIQIGFFRNPAANDYSFVSGDFPLWIIRPNVTVQCGIDGKRENNCTFYGGFIQILVQPRVPTPDGGFDFFQPIDNLKVQGITFSGQVVDTSPFSGLSVQMSNPGKNIRFENCLWTDMVVPSGLISVSTNTFLVRTGIDIADMSIDVTLSNCTFQNIIYDNPLLHVRHQTLSLERCWFRNVTLSVLAGQYCKGASDDWEFSFEDGCTGLMYCEPRSVCSMSGVCIENFEYKGPSMVFLAEDNVDNRFEDLYNDDEDIDCDLGIARSYEENIYNCTEIFTEPSCPNSR